MMAEEKAAINSTPSRNKQNCLTNHTTFEDEQFINDYSTCKDTICQQNGDELAIMDLSSSSSEEEIKPPAKCQDQQQAFLASSTHSFPVSSGCEHQCLIDTGNLSAFTKPPGLIGQQQQPIVSIQELVKRRSELLRQLADSPNNYLAQLALEDCDSQINYWAVGNRTPGVFYGSTDAPICRSRGVRTFEQMESESLPDAESRKQFTKSQPWVSKKTLTAGPRIMSGIGKQLLLRMGWHEGSGLGKKSDGPYEPVVLPENVRTSTGRRGLSTDGESFSLTSSWSLFSNSNTCHCGNTSPLSSSKNVAPTVAPFLPFSHQSDTVRHPVTELTKYCAKKHYSPPEFTEVFAYGPAHRPQFLIKVRVNNVDYQPSQPSTSKREARKLAATMCLEALDLWSNDDSTLPFLVRKWVPASEPQHQ